MSDFTEIGSRGWTRTSDRSVNSRLLCQLSYAGLASESLPDRLDVRPTRGRRMSRLRRYGAEVAMWR